MRTLIISTLAMSILGCTSTSLGFDDQVNIWLEIKNVSASSLGIVNQPISLEISYLGSETKPEIYIGPEQIISGKRTITVGIIHNHTKKLPYTNFRDPGVVTASFTPKVADTYIFEGVRREGLTNIVQSSISVTVTNP